jgi:hypothetical protein
MKTKDSVYTRTLARGIQIAGSVEQLARFLGSTPAEIAKWASGESNPPMPLFFAIVDVVAASALAPVALENLPLARARRSSVFAKEPVGSFSEVGEP